MDFAEHAAATSLTAIYPGSGTGSVGALSYVALGLVGESAEVLEKATAHDGPGLVAELGDVAWYLSRLHRELDLNPQTPDSAVVVSAVVVSAVADRATLAEVSAAGTTSAATLVVAAGRVAELVKKALRDDAGSRELTDDRRRLLTAQLGRTVASWTAVHEVYGLDPALTLATNIAKLTDRRDRGVLGGSGDNR